MDMLAGDWRAGDWKSQLPLQSPKGMLRDRPAPTEGKVHADGLRAGCRGFNRRGDWRVGDWKSQLPLQSPKGMLRDRPAPTEGKVHAGGLRAGGRGFNRQALLLILILLAAAALRLYDVNWDQFQHVHPDERFIVWVADTVSWPDSLAEALDPERSTINPFRWPPNDSGQGTHNDLAGQPRNYAYGHFPLYLLVVTAHLGQEAANWLGENAYAFPGSFQPLHTLGRHLASYNYLPLVGRALSALADLGTLLLVYFLARRLVRSRVLAREGVQGDADLQSKPHPSTASCEPLRDSAQDADRAILRMERAGRGIAEAIPLLAAAAYAFAVLPIQLSHFVTVDALLTFFVTASVALAARTAQRSEHPQMRAATGESANTEYAVRIKRYPWLPWLLAGVAAGLAIGSKFSAVLLALPLLVAALYGLPAASRWRQAAVVVGRLAAVGAVALLVFALTNPFAIIEFSAYVRQITAQNAMVSGAMDAPYTRQYIGTLPYLYFVQQLSQWGLGWPLGVIAWGGLAWATVTFVRRRATPALTVMLAWALPYFATTGAFHTKFLRYMAPLLPFLLVFGAGAALAGYRWLVRRWGKRGRVGWTSLVVITLAFTVAWALAFMNVYRQEHPWIQASRWIYENIPADSKLLTEHWDDALPLTLDELPGLRPQRREYERVELPLWDPDTPEKLDLLVAELSSADTIVFASDRLSAPMQRLGIRYPLGSQYYRLLFAGDLGYRPVAEFTAYPRLGPVKIRDDRADESFYVYDHPRVLVLENAERLPASLLRARLGRYLPLGKGSSGSNVAQSAGLCADHRAQSVGLWHEASGIEASAGLPHDAQVPDDRLKPSLQTLFLQSSGLRYSAARVPGLARMLPQAPAPDAPLTLPQPVDTLPVVADFRWNQAASRSVPLAVATWWLALSLLGWLAWPLLFPLLGGLRDRGYGLSRAAGWLLVGWIHWIGVSLGVWQNRLAPLGVILGGLALAGIVAAWAQRRQMAAFWAERWRLLLGQETLFATTFLAFVGVRLLNPDLWQPWNGGEKFMEFAFLNAILRSPSFPPYDPYFAGGIINYYYYGLYLVSLPIKLTGIFPEVAFNLAVPGLFALTAVGVFSVTYSLAAGRRSGGAAGQRSGGAEERRGRGAEEQRSGGAEEQRSGGAEEQRSRGAEERRSRGAEEQRSRGAEEQRSEGAPVWTALISTGMALLMGNLRGLKWLGDVYLAVLRGAPLPHYDYWGASRVIPYTINEFPLWTFTFADLHPHMIAMPFGLLVVGLALNWLVVRGQESVVRGQESGDRSQESGARSQWSVVSGQALEVGAEGVEPEDISPQVPLSVSPRPPVPVSPRPRVPVSPCLLVSLSLGALGAINTWDLPTYALLVAGVILLAGWRAQRWRGLAGGAGWAAVAVVLAVTAYWPFYANYQAQVGGGQGSIVGRFLAWTRAASPTGDWLSVWGFFVLLALSYVVAVWVRGRRGTEEQRGGGADEWGSGGAEERRRGGAEERRRGGAEGRGSGGAEGQRRWLLALLALSAVLAVLAAAGRPTAALAALPLCLALPLIVRRKAPAGEAFTVLLLALGLGIVAGIELVYLRDFLEGGEWYRMNTLFKFSVPAWLLLSTAGGVMLRRGWAAAGKIPAWIGWPWRAGISALLAGGLVFLVAGIPARVDDRFPGERPPIGTLDATAYMTVGRYTWPSFDSVIELRPERDAIQWLLANVQGTPVIAEAPAGWYDVGGTGAGYDYYRAGGLRVASLTGFPTFVGQHQSEQRPGDQVGPRTELAQEFFRTEDIGRARALMRELRVSYVYIGQLERILFGVASLAKFDALVALGDLEMVYRNEGVTIYHVLVGVE